MGDTMPIEWEIKRLIPDPQTAGRLLADRGIAALACGAPERKLMDARYYALGRWTLRLRTEDGISVAAIKIPRGTDAGGISERDEYETEADSIETALPGLVAAGAPKELADLCGKAWQERCHINFVRRSVPLVWTDGTRAVFCVDEGAIHAGGGTQPLLEMELELRSGNPEPLLVLAEQLTRAYCLAPGLQSKYARGLEMLQRP
jgi:inorganic triphosphatase YgiF